MADETTTATNGTGTTPRDLNRKYKIALLTLGAGTLLHAGIVATATRLLTRSILTPDVWQAQITSGQWAWYALALTVLGLYGGENIAAKWVEGKKP